MTLSIKKNETKKFVGVRLLRHEDEALHRVSSQLGITKSELIRKKLRDSSCKIVDTTSVFDTVNKIMTAQYKVHTNINQVAKHLNGRTEKLNDITITEFNTLLNLHLEQREQLYKQMRKIYKLLQ